jgi:hypothetical protein
MTIAQGIKKQTVIAKQVSLGTPKTGAGGQILRRRTSTFSALRDTFESDEIVSHHQSTGVTYGLKKPQGKIEGLVSAGTYKLLMAALCEKDFVAGIAGTSVSHTIAGTGPTWTLTRSTGWLAEGFKIGDVITFTAGSFNAANLNHNMLIVGLTATVATVMVLNGVALVAEGPIATSVATVKGKKTLVPLTGHTNDYFTVEEWYSDLTKSEMYSDVKINTLTANLPASGNAGFSFDFLGLVRALNTSQQLTTPTAETTTGIMNAVNGVLLVNATAVTNVTGLQFTVSQGVTPSGPVVGSNQSPDLSTGRIKVSGSFTAYFDGTTSQALYDGETVTSLVAVLTADQTNNSDVIGFSMGRIKLTGDDDDDGEKGLIRTYPFTAEINSAGGAALAWDQTIISIQDSQA